MENCQKWHEFTEISKQIANNNCININNNRIYELWKYEFAVLF